MASIRHVRYEQQLWRYHDRNVHECDFNVSDLVLRRIQSITGAHKLSSPWEGPFVVSGIVVPGTYHLQRPDGTDLGNPWNIEHLRCFYPYKCRKCKAMYPSTHSIKFVIFQILHTTCSSFFTESFSTRSVAVSRPSSQPPLRV